MAGDLLPFGRVVAAHGIRGEVKVRFYNEDSPLIGDLVALFLDLPTGVRRVEVARIRRTPSAWIVKLAGVEDRNAAEALGKPEVLVDPAWLPPADEDEFYYHDLVGMKVVTQGGEELGEVESLFDTGASDVLVVCSTGGRERLIPFVEEVVVEVDLDRGLVTVDPPEGLLDT